LDLLNSGSQPTIFLYFSDSLKKKSLADVRTAETELSWWWKEAKELKLTRLQRQVKP